LILNLFPGIMMTTNRVPALAYSPPEPVQPTGTTAIGRLRALHSTMDTVVLRAYGWDDLADGAAAEFIEQDADEGKTAKTRLDWPDEFRDEVLARLLALNAERATSECAAGVTVETEDDETIDDNDDD